MIKNLLLNVLFFFIGSLAFLFIAFSSGMASNANADKTLLISIYSIIGFIHVLLCWAFLRKNTSKDIICYLMIIVVLLYWGAYSIFF